MFKRASRLAAIVMAIAAAGCSGSDGAQGPQGPQGNQGVQGPQGPSGNNGQDLVATAKPESCSACHAKAGAEHQAVYNQYVAGGNVSVVTDSVQTVSSVVTWTFTVKQNGAPVLGIPALISTPDENGVKGQKTFYMGLFDPSNANSLVPFSAKPIAFGAPVATLVDGQYLVTAAATTWAPESSVAYVYGYLAWQPLPTERPKGSSDHVILYKNIVNFSKTFNGGGTLDAWQSSANVSACENCHGAPYRKHGYRMAKVAGLADFAACKACHYDTRVGADHDWQVMVDDPVSYAATAVTAAQKTKYAYKAKVMADTHMSHAMEFDFPQSMANCVTCHAGKLDRILDDKHFTLETCRSCHPVTGPATAYVDNKRAPPLKVVIPAGHGALLNNLYADAATPATCNGCHSVGNGFGAPVFSQIHTGTYAGFYWKADFEPFNQNTTARSVVYTAAGNKASDLFNVTIDSAVLNATTLTVTYTGHRTGVVDADPAVVGSITPTLLVGLYGYDTKDFVVDPHGSVAGVRNLEWVYGATNPRFKNYSRTTGTNTVTWQVDVDLSAWQPMFATTIKRAEIGVIPALKDTTGKVTYALNAPTRTFNLRTNSFENFFAPIVDAAKCNKCHEALATTFHTPDRGGNVVMCRLCHNVRSGAAHIELQSRSIDSYIHAIHSFQAMDLKNATFADAVSAMRWGLKNEAGYPIFTLKACETCHNPGTYNPPANDRSLPGVMSAASNINGRNIGTIPQYVTGPGARACGSCHKAAFIKEDVPAGVVIAGTPVTADPNAASEVTAVIQHTGMMGYLLDYTSTTLDAAIAKVQSFFK